MERWLEPWEEFQFEAEELIDAGDQVVVTYRQRGRGKGSGIEVENTLAAVATMRDGKVIRGHVYLDRAAALKAAYDRHAAHAAAAPGDSVLHLLDRGPAVRKLQELLRAAGNSIEPDGVFGQQTEAAVRQFQSDHGLAADGVVGSRTWAVLRS